MSKENVVYIYTIEYYSAFKKEGNPVTWKMLVKRISERVNE
jgi:hypothetical protein